MAIVLVVIAAVLVVGAAYLAIVLYHEHRFDKNKDDRYEYYMTRKEADNDYTDDAQG